MKNKIKIIIKDILIFIGFFIIYYVSSYLLIYLFNIDTKNTYLCYIMELIGSIIGCIYLFLIYHKTYLKDFKNFKGNILNYIKKYLPKFILAYIIAIIINVIIALLTGATSTNESIDESLLITYPFVGIPITCILAPFYEETLFRLVPRNIFKNKWLYIIITGIIFGSVHLLVATSYLELLYIISYSILGCTLSYIYYDSDNIYASMLIHIINNTFLTILMFL